jgi:hypothetical protein
VASKDGASTRAQEQEGAVEGIGAEEKDAAALKSASEKGEDMATRGVVVEGGGGEARKVKPVNANCPGGAREATNVSSET